ncbi:hypothetical protein SETIT_1G047600v2 [Setaria italica]|uniref:Reverse transcriptase domain-containing protein n=1 Tax=Setaria italica TaxID=4555 RepID=A0A368PIZ0_SETIT|nr:hypothetical protein SETIT_1G047600v2 [Setaria italica]
MVQADTRISHPAATNQPYPVLQYADDTLLLLKADLGGLTALKQLCGHTEDCDHIIFRCGFSSHVWRAMGFQIEGASVKSLWTVGRPAMVPSRQFYTLLLLVSWMLWKQRNDLVFQHIQPCHSTFWRSCRDEARLWSRRFSREDRLVADVWCSMFNSM